MKSIKAFLVISLSISMLAFAQQQDSSLTIQQAEKVITDIRALKDDNETSLTSLESTLPVTEKTIDREIANLQTVTQAQLTLTDSTLERIRTFINSSENDEKQIDAHLTRVTDVLESLNEIEQINQNPLTKKQASPEQIQELIAQAKQQKNILEVKKGMYQNKIEQAKALLALAEKWQSAQLSTFQSSTTTEKKPAVESTEQQKDFEAKAQTFRRQLEVNRDKLSLTQQQALQMGLYHYEDLAWLTTVDTHLAENLFDQNLILATNPKLLGELSIPAVTALLTSLQATQNSLDQTLNTLDARELAFRNRRAVLTNNSFPENLEDAFSERKANILSQKAMIQPIVTNIENLARQKSQQALFENDAFYETLVGEKANLSSLIKGIVKIPFQLALQSRIAIDALLNNFKTHFWRKLGLLVLAICTIVLVIRFFYRLMHNQLEFYRSQDQAKLDDTVDNSTKPSEKYSRFSFLKTTRFLLYVLDENWINFGVSLSLHATIYISDVTSPSNILLHLIVGVVSTTILWFSIVKLSVSTQGFSAKTARWCRIFGLLFAAVILLYANAKLIADNTQTVLFYEKVLFIIGIPTLLKIRQLTAFLLAQRQDDDFLYRILKWWLRLTPWVIILCMLIGLAGYSNFAWLTAQRASIMAVAILVIFLGFEALQDLRKWLQILCIRHVKNGVFVAQDLVVPLLNIIKLLWVITSGAAVFKLFNWTVETPVISHIVGIANYPLITLNAFNVTLRNILLTALVMYAVIKVGRWFKNISYRWLFSHLSDLSIRNSLSIFGQYFVVTASFLIGLQVIGIDLTTFTVFAGALGVGVGLGLQNIAKNFISGLLLLAERPLRTGDTVTIDNAEGEVMRIGMRSITVKTFSSEEVIVPNSDVIEKPFKNWTYSDQLLRTELYVSASYDADPEIVMSLLETIMNDNEHICRELEPMAIMWQYDDSAISYRIQYHIDQSKSGLFLVRRQILSKIWSEFKANGIEIPYPKRDVILKNT